MAISCVTEYSYERAPGSAYLYNESGLSYNDALFDGFVVFFSSLSLATSWTYESPIEGCLPVYALFMDGTDFTFMDDTDFEYN